MIRFLGRIWRTIATPVAIVLASMIGTVAVGLAAVGPNIFGIQYSPSFSYVSGLFDLVPSVARLQILPTPTNNNCLIGNGNDWLSLPCAVGAIPNLNSGGTPVANLQNATSINLPAGGFTDTTFTVFISLTANCTVDLSTSGAGGLDNGTVAATTWYALYVIQGASGKSCEATLATPLTNGTPTTHLPSGYTYYAYAGRVRTDGSAHLLYELDSNTWWIDSTDGTLTDTFPLPSTASGIQIWGCGPGGPGGSGSIITTATAISGGAGGGGGLCTGRAGFRYMYQDTGASVTVTVPPVAAGATAVTASATTAGNTASDPSGNLTIVSAGSVTLWTGYHGGAGQGGRPAASASTGGGSAGFTGAASTSTGGTGSGTNGSAGGGPAAPSISGLSAAGAGATTGAIGLTGTSAFAGGAAGGGTGGGPESTCTTTTLSGGGGGRALGDFGQIVGGANGVWNGGSALTGAAPLFTPAPGPGGGWGGPNATHVGGNGGAGGLGGGGAGGGSVCGSGSMTSGAGGNGGPAGLLLKTI